MSRPWPWGAAPDDRSRSPVVPSRPGDHHPFRPAAGRGGQTHRPAAGGGRDHRWHPAGADPVRREDHNDAVPAYTEARAERAGQPRRRAVHVRRRVRTRPAPDPGPRARGRERIGQLDHSSAVTRGGPGVWLASRHHVRHVLPFALFVGTAMAVTAFPVLARILTDRGMHRTRIGGLALASAAI